MATMPACPRLPECSVFFGVGDLKSKLGTVEGLQKFGDDLPPVHTLCHHVHDEEKEALLEQIMAHVLLHEMGFDKVHMLGQLHALHPAILDSETKPNSLTGATGMTAAHMCVLRCQREAKERQQQQQLLRFILTHRPHSAAKSNEHGETPLHLLAGHSDVCQECLKLLLRVAPQTTGHRTVSGKLPLHVLMQYRGGLPINIEAVCAVLATDPSAALEKAKEERISFTFSGRSNSALSQSVIIHWSPLERAKEQGMAWFMTVLDRVMWQRGLWHVLTKPRRVN